VVLLALTLQYNSHCVRKDSTFVLSPVNASGSLPRNLLVSGARLCGGNKPGPLEQGLHQSSSSSTSASFWTSRRWLWWRVEWLSADVSGNLELPPRDRCGMLFVRGVCVIQAQCLADVLCGVFVNVHGVSHYGIDSDIGWFFLNLCLCLHGHRFVVGQM
jgi:hypothetical protein